MTEHLHAYTDNEPTRCPACEERGAKEERARLKAEVQRLPSWTSNNGSMRRIGHYRLRSMVLDLLADPETP